jgi:hypothetical protein
MTTRKRFKCRFCGAMLPAWLPVVQRPEASMLLYHLGQHHLEEVGPYLQRMETECITTVVVDAYEVVESRKVTVCELRRDGVQEDGGAGLDGRSPSHADACVEPPADAHGVPTAGGGAADGRETHVCVHVRSAVYTRDALIVGRLY